MARWLRRWSRPSGGSASRRLSAGNSPFPARASCCSAIERLTSAIPILPTVTDPITALKAAERAARGQTGKDVAARHRAAEARATELRRVRDAISHASLRIDEAAQYAAATLSERLRPGRDTHRSGALVQGAADGTGLVDRTTDTNALTPASRVVSSAGVLSMNRQEMTASEWFSRRVALQRIGEKPSVLMLDALERGSSSYARALLERIETLEAATLRDFGALLARDG